MTNEELLREFNSLPAKARCEAEDFIVFLKARYTQKKSKMANGDLLNNKFVGMWKDREEFKDGSAWVRKIRHEEWSN